MEGCMENLWEVRKNWTTRNNVNWNDSGGQSIKNWGLISFGSQHEDEQTCHFPAPMLLFSKFQEEGIWLDQPGACTHLWWEEDVALRSCCPIRSNAGDVCSIPDREAEVLHAQWWPKMLKKQKTKQNPAVNNSRHLTHLSWSIILVDSCQPRNNISSQDPESPFDSQTTEIEVRGFPPLLAPSRMTLKHVSGGTSPHCPKQ